jgi:hypothetical protein
MSLINISKHYKYSHNILKRMILFKMFRELFLKKKGKEFVY